MSTLINRTTKGSSLTWNEVDANFTNLNNDKAEKSGATFTGLLEASQNASGTVGGETIIQRFRSNPTGNNVFLDAKSVRHNAGSTWNGLAMRLQYQVDSTPMGFIAFNSTNISKDVAIGTESSIRFIVSSAGTVNIVGGGSAGSTQAVSFHGSAPNDSLVINSTGRIGIGTASPTSRLNVSSSGDVVRLDSTSTDCGILLFDSAAGSRIGTRSGNIIFDTNSSESVRVDTNRRLLVGTTSSRSVGGAARLVQIEGTSGTTTNLSITRNSDDNSQPSINFGKSRGTSNTSVAIVSPDDGVGSIIFSGADGVSLVTAASINAQIDGSPGSTIMPGRLVFSTTSTTAGAIPTARMTIKNNGTINFSSVATYADNTAAITGGLAVGDVYRTSTGQLMIRF
jgi:hypothetical protein